MKIQRGIEMCHPILVKSIKRIQTRIIDVHKPPIKLFETGRAHDRHQMLIQKGKTRDIISRHLYTFENDPVLYCTAVDFVYYDGKWSWNLRDSTVQTWYILFGNLVLDICPELEWAGRNRKSRNYCHYQLKRSILVDDIENTPCVVPRD